MVYADASNEICCKTKSILALLPLPPPLPLLLLIQIKPKPLNPQNLYQTFSFTTTSVIITTTTTTTTTTTKTTATTKSKTNHCHIQRSLEQSKSLNLQQPLDRRRPQVWSTNRVKCVKDSTVIRGLSRSFWQPHKIVKAITITLLAAVAAIKRPSRCIAVA